MGDKGLSVVRCSRKCTCAPNVARMGRWHLVREREGRLMYSYDTWDSKEEAIRIAVDRGIRVSPEKSCAEALAR